jgi:hypothetical protein
MGQGSWSLPGFRPVKDCVVRRRAYVHVYSDTRRTGRPGHLISRRP